MSNRLVRILGGNGIGWSPRQRRPGSALIVAGTEVAVVGDRLCPGENLLGRPWRWVWINCGNGQLAGDRMSDNPVRHCRPLCCLETSDDQVSPAADATGARFHKRLAQFSP